MRTELPRRPYVELPPPPGGLDAARREASARRRRRAVAVVGAAATTAVVAVVALVVGGGAGDDAVLRPAPVAPAPQQPTPDAASPAVTGVASPATVVAPRKRADGAASAVSPSVDRTTAPGPRQQQRLEPVLSRSRTTYAGAPRVCRTSGSADNTSVHPGTDWCVEAAATPVSGGERLSLTMCRDSTSAGSLTFATSREVDFAVVQGGSTVWSWSHDHPSSASPHTLSAPVDGCWTWSLVWSGVTQAGGAAAHGGYTLVATTAAEELKNDAQTRVDFRY